MVKWKFWSFNFMFYPYIIRPVHNTFLEFSFLFIVKVGTHFITTFDNRIVKKCKFGSNPSSIYSWFLKPLSLLHSGFPTKKSWVVAYFFNFFHFFVGKKFFFIKVLLCNFLVRTLQCKKKFKKIIFWPSKYEKTNPKSCILKQKFRRFRNFLSKPIFCPTAQMAEFMFPNVA